MELVTQLVLVGVWSAGAWIFSRGQVTVGLLITFATYLGLFFWPLRNVIELAQEWALIATGAKRLFRLIDAQKDVQLSKKPYHLTGIRGDIALENVSFSYAPGQNALTSVNMFANSGEMIGLVGHTGAGKSTVINLIARIYDATEGVVSLDGIDIRDLSPEDVRGKMGVVLQDAYLFLGSVKDNIAYGKPEAALEAIMAAAMAANAHDFIVNLPNGYDTQLGPGGFGLSGGQRQRIGIARALLLDPPVLLMDEATSSVDTETELRIQEAIENLVRNRTTIIIAHRLSTLRLANRLYVLDRGRVSENGSHQNLMKNNGPYRRMVERQRQALHVIGVGE